MNFATIKYYDISNGPGVRTSLYVSGCTHHCKNCFNPMTWDFAYGEPFTCEVEDQIMQNCAPDYIAGLTDSYAVHLFMQIFVPPVGVMVPDVHR